MADNCIKTNVNLKEFEKCAADRAPMGTIAKENGATITRMGMSGKMETVEANAGDKVYKGDIIKTPNNGTVAIALPDKTIVSGGSNSEIDIARFAVSSQQVAGELDQVKRGIGAISGSIAKSSPDSVSFQSPGMTLSGVRG